MDIELTADNFMEYMADKAPEDEKLTGEAMLMQHMEDVKAEKDNKKETRYF